MAHQTTMHLATTAGLNVALPAMAREFDAGIGTVIWVQVAYGLALAAGTIPLGQASRVLNQRRLVLAANGLTILLELAIFFSPSIYLVIAARALESMARAVPWLVLQVIALGRFPPEQRGRVLGFTRLAQGAALTVSPAITGYVTEHWGWRWMFLGSVAAFCLVQAGISRWLPAHPAGEPEPLKMDVSLFDLPGTCLLALGLTGLLSAVQVGASTGAQALGLALAASGAVLLAGFVLVELRSPSPMLPLFVFRVPGVAVSSLQVIFLGLANGALPVLFPLLFISGYGWTAAFAGAVLLFLNVARVPSAPVAGWAADRFGAGRVLALATGISLAGQILAALLGFPAPVGLVVLSLTLIGLGQGVVTVANLKQIFSSMPAQHLHLAPGTNIVLLQLGTAAGQAFVAAAFQVAGISAGSPSGPNLAVLPVTSTTILILTALFGGGMFLAQLAPLVARLIAGRGSPACNEG